jgi:hypothetical protein
MYNGMMVCGWITASFDCAITILQYLQLSTRNWKSKYLNGTDVAGKKQLKKTVLESNTCPRKRRLQQYNLKRYFVQCGLGQLVS